LILEVVSSICHFVHHTVIVRLFQVVAYSVTVKDAAVHVTANARMDAVETAIAGAITAIVIAITVIAIVICSFCDH
jgi:hypothetical protein